MHQIGSSFYFTLDIFLLRLSCRPFHFQHLTSVCDIISTDEAGMEVQGQALRANTVKGRWIFVQVTGLKYISI
jgi:hypothetical protein